MAAFPIQLDRARRTTLAAQIYSAIREGIENGRLASGARLRSWQDLAAQLGVSRGTVRVAYERLIAEQIALMEARQLRMVGPFRRGPRRECAAGRPEAWPGARDASHVAVVHLVPNVLVGLVGKH
jgi:DNA-binding FadR family transcriptional regulator